jgi:hypothetical protein
MIVTGPEAVSDDDERNDHVEDAQFRASGRICRTTACAAASEYLEVSTASMIFLGSILSLRSKLHESERV